MPLKLNVGLSRKVGEANYGSRGASVNLELELDSAIVSEPGRLQERIRQMFALAKQSIDEELHHSAGVAAANKNGNGHTAKDDHRNATSSRNGSNGNGHSRGYQRGSTTPGNSIGVIRARPPPKILATRSAVCAFVECSRFSRRWRRPLFLLPLVFPP